MQAVSDIPSASPYADQVAASAAFPDGGPPLLWVDASLILAGRAPHADHASASVSHRADETIDAHSSSLSRTGQNSGGYADVGFLHLKQNATLRSARAGQGEFSCLTSL